MEQHPAEFAALLDALAIEGVTSILEVGVFQGGTLARFSAAFPDIHVVGIDPRPMIAAEDVHRLRVVHGSSHDPKVRQRARLLNDGEPFDFVFIDGDHSYDGVREDWNWSRFEGRMVAFHDICSTHTCPGVVKWWDEFSADAKQGWERWREFTFERKLGRNGIGLVWPT
jgi:precorrin-6B methylase 2